jgi:hypothetical protein
VATVLRVLRRTSRRDVTALFSSYPANKYRASSGRGQGEPVRPRNGHTQ